MKQYLDLLQEILDAPLKPGRNGQVRSLFGKQLTFCLSKGFPAVTTKRLAFKQVVAELLFFIHGQTDIRVLWENNCHIWDANWKNPQWQQVLKDQMLDKYELGYIYGAQWKNFNGSGTDQISTLVSQLKNDPFSRRHVVTAWNPEELYLMCLPPCHMMFICDVQPNGLQCESNKQYDLNMQVIMRSCDVFLGLPFNIASYAILNHMLCQICNFTPGKLQLCITNVHLYEKHEEVAHEQTKRESLPLPLLWVNPMITELEKFTIDDVKLIGYTNHGTLKANMVV